MVFLVHADFVVRDDTMSDNTPPRSKSAAKSAQVQPAVKRRAGRKGQVRGEEVDDEEPGDDDEYDNTNAQSVLPSKTPPAKRSSPSDEVNVVKRVKIEPGLSGSRSSRVNTASSARVRFQLGKPQE